MASNTSDCSATAWVGEQCCPSLLPQPQLRPLPKDPFWACPNPWWIAAVEVAGGRSGVVVAVFLLWFPWGEHGRPLFMSIWCQVESHVSGENSPLVNTQKWMMLWWDRGAVSGVSPLTRRRAVSRLLHKEFVSAAAPTGGNGSVSSASIFNHCGSRVVVGRAHKSWQAFLLPLCGVVAVWQLLTTSCLCKLYQTPLCRGCCNDFLTRIYPGTMTQSVSNCNHTVSVALMVSAIL